MSESNTQVVSTSKDAEEIEMYLKDTAKIGGEAAQNYSKQFVKKGVDSVTVMQTFDENELKVLIFKALHSADQQQTKSPEARIAEAKEEAEKLRKELVDDCKVINESTLKSLNESLAKVSTNNCWTLKPKTSDVLLTELETLISKLNVVKESCTKGTYASNADLVNSISSSSACKAVHFINDEKFGNRGARCFLDFKQSAKQFGDIDLKPLARSHIVEATFTSSGENSLFEKLRETGGGSSAASAKIAGFYSAGAGAASLSSSSSTQHHSSSTNSEQVITNRVIKEKNALYNMNSFSMSPSKFVIHADALQELKEIDTNNKAKAFLSAFGSHVLLTDHITGGIFIQTLDINFSSAVNIRKAEGAFAKATEKSAGFSIASSLIGGSVGVATTSNLENSSFSDALNSGETYKCNISYKTIGPQVTDLSTFTVALGSSNMTHCLISNGFNPDDSATWVYTPVWDVAARNSEIMKNYKTVPKLLRNAWLSLILDNKKVNLERFMISAVERCLNEPMQDDSSDWHYSWAIKLGLRKKDTVVLGEKSTTYSTWDEGATKGILFLDRQHVQAPKNSVLLGFHLERYGNNIRYQIHSAPLGTEMNRASSISFQHVKEDHTSWEEGAEKELAFLDRHLIKAGDNRVLIGFVLQRSGDKIRYMYQTAQVHLEDELVPLIGEQTDYSPWEEGSEKREICFLDRHHVCVPSGRVLTGFGIERKDWQIRYKIISRALSK
ncbi:predicted protein [Naegleria gruberi]|uniref:Predicted protein n=1 Tax=Naegleria gruberi TaxID=5762 RepID=D2VGJ6_NAEGR|nr:uncharacterized protein NAEGRDRAFT_68002 [Naegleria gruberi]EFC43975.1 predicted protein [Naegleria gruberi]|eukprot:XP_002676719.1 predicted protein [Naegleria gruberi strain NEG-M]